MNYAGDRCGIGRRVATCGIRSTLGDLFGRPLSDCGSCDGTIRGRRHATLAVVKRRLVVGTKRLAGLDGLRASEGVTTA